MTNISRNKSTLPHLVLVWLCLTSTAPFIFYSWPYHPYKALTFVCLAIMTIILTYTKKFSLSKNITLVFCTQIAYYVIISIAFSAYKNINLCIQLIACMVIVPYIKQFISFRSFAKSYIIIIIAMGIGGVIMFFLHMLIGINPLFEVPYSESGITYFLGLTSTNIYYGTEGIRLIRFSGFFDEPGMFALYAILALLINKIYFDNKKYEKLLIFTTLFTLSMAFYIIVIIYFILFYFQQKYIKYGIAIFLAGSLCYVILNNYSGDNNTMKYLRKFTIERFEKSDDGRLKGNNRIINAEIDKSQFKKSPLWGNPNSNQAGANIYTILARYGIIGSFFYYLPLIYLIFLVFKTHGHFGNIGLKVIMLLLVNFAHRPEFSATITTLILYTMIYKFEEYTYESISHHSGS